MKQLPSINDIYAWSSEWNDREIKIINEAFQKYYSDGLTSFELISRKTIHCIWFNAIDMYAYGSRDYDIVFCIGSFLEPYLCSFVYNDVFKILPDARTVNYGLLNSKNSGFSYRGKFFSSYESYFEELVSKELELYKKWAKILLPDKYIDKYIDIKKTTSKKMIIDICNQGLHSKIIQDVFKENAIILEESEDRMLFVLYDKQIYELTTYNNDLVLKRYCNRSFQFQINKTHNDSVGMCELINELYLYSYLLTPDEWLEKYAYGDEWKKCKACISIDE